MFAEQRHRVIIDELAAIGRVRVTALATQLNVAEETIRRDLDKLAEDNLLQRVHGGAVGRKATPPEIALESRLATNVEAKARIAHAAARFIPGVGGSVLCDAGSTTTALTPHLPSDGITVITHAPGVALEAVSSGVSAIHLLPGKLRPTTQAAVGPATLESLHTLSPDVAFVGCNGVSLEGFLTPDPDEAAVKKEIIHRAALTVLLADSSKFHERALVTFASWDQIDVLVCDAPLPGSLAEAARTSGIEVVYA